MVNGEIELNNSSLFPMQSPHHLLLPSSVESITMVFLAMSNLFAIKRTNSLFSLPFSGGAETRTRITSTYESTNPVVEAFGVTLN